jgi:hypothetical protein
VMSLSTPLQFQRGIAVLRCVLSSTFIEDLNGSNKIYLPGVYTIRIGLNCKPIAFV